MATLQAAIDARKAKRGAVEFNAAVDSMGNHADKTRNKLGQFTKGIDKTAARAEKARGSISMMFGGITAGLAVAQTVRVMASFEETMATVGAVTRADAQAFEDLTNTAKMMGATTRFSASEAGDGLLFLARAGFSSEQAIAALPSTLSLASAGNLELGESADFASNILSQFGLAAEETDRVVDTLIITSNRANTDVRQLAEAMKYAGPVAGALGISIEETASALGVLGDSGIQASMAGTNLRGILSGLLDPSDKAEAALKRLGIRLEEVDPNTRTLTEIFKAFGDAGLDAAAAVEIFNRRNAAAALILAGNNKKIGELTEANKQFRGEAERVAKAMDSTLAGSFRSLRSAIEALMIETGDSGFLGVLKQVTDTIVGAVRVLAGMEDSVETNRAAAFALAKTLKILGTVLSAVIAIKAVQFFGNLAAMIFTASTNTIKFIPNILKMTAALAAAAAVATSFRIGTTIYEETRWIQEGMAWTVSTVEKGWAYIKYITEVAFAGIGEGWRRLWIHSVAFFADRMSDVAAGLDDLESILAAVGIDANLGAAGLDQWTNSLKKMAETTNEFEVGAFRGLRGFLTSAAGQRTAGGDTSGAIIRMIDPQRTEELTRNDLLVLNRLFEMQMEELAKQGGSQAEFASKRIAEEFVKGLESLDGVPLQMRLDMMRRVRDEAVATAEATRKASMTDINRNFTDRPDRSFFEALTDNLATDITNIQNLLKGLVGGFDEVDKAAEETVGTLGTIANTSAEFDKLQSAIDSIGDESLPEVTEDAVRAAEAFEKMVEKINEERAVVGMAAEERQKYLLVLEAERLAREANGLVTDADLERLTKEIDKLYALREAQQRAAELEQTFDSMGDTIARAFEDIVFQAQSVSEAIEGMIRQLARLAFQQAVTQPLGNLFSGFFGGLLGSANGNVFGAGRVIPFADGGVVSGPTLFPMTSGQTGLMGEAGPEAIMPLQRTSDGRLGVAAQGGGGPTVVKMYINTPDADSFRRSEHQITSRLKRRM
jgi:TP901 family phage tail tape measure protein